MKTTSSQLTWIQPTRDKFNLVSNEPLTVLKLEKLRMLLSIFRKKKKERERETVFSTRSCASFLKATIYSSRQSGGSGQVWRKTRLRRLMKCYWKHCPFDRPFAPAMPLCTNSNIELMHNEKFSLLSRGSPRLAFCQSVVSLSSLFPSRPRLVVSFYALSWNNQERENGFLEHECTGLKFHLTGFEG